VLESSVLIKIWRGSFTRRLIYALGARGGRIASGSIIIGFLLGDGPGWLQESAFGRLVQGGVRFITGLVQGIKNRLAAAAADSKALDVLSGENPGTAGFVCSLLLGLGLTLLAGAAVRGGSWWPAAVLLVVLSVTAARFWPRSREIWRHSLTARLWTKLTAVDEWGRWGQ